MGLRSEYFLSVVAGSMTLIGAGIFIILQYRLNELTLRMGVIVPPLDLLRIGDFGCLGSAMASCFLTYFTAFLAP
jgi:hypothetical protein